MAPTLLPRLTFGVEIEFHLPFIIPGTPDPDPQDLRDANIISSSTFKTFDQETYNYQALAHIARTLSAAGIPACSETREGPSSDWIVMGEGLCPPTQRYRDVRHIETLNKYGWIPVELVSPPLYFTEEGVAQIEEVCKLMTSKYRIFINPNCGVHIHVGFRDGGYDPQILGNLMATIWTFEPLLTSIHPRHRQRSRFCVDIRYHHQTEEYENDDDGWAEDKRLLGHSDSSKKSHKESLDSTNQKLQDRDNTCKDDDEEPFSVQKSLEELLERKDEKNEDCDGLHLWWQTLSKYVAYNCNNLLSNNTTSKKTVEFRQHEATMDPERLRHWIRVCCGLVEFAATVPTPMLNRFCRTHIYDKEDDFSLRQFLDIVGLPVEGLYYQRRADRLMMEEEVIVYAPDTKADLMNTLMAEGRNAQKESS